MSSQWHCGSLLFESKAWISNLKFKIQIFRRPIFWLSKLSKRCTLILSGCCSMAPMSSVSSETLESLLAQGRSLLRIRCILLGWSRAPSQSQHWQCYISVSSLKNHVLVPTNCFLTTVAQLFLKFPQISLFSKAFPGYECRAFCRLHCRTFIVGSKISSRNANNTHSITYSIAYSITALGRGWTFLVETFQSLRDLLSESSEFKCRELL